MAAPVFQKYDTLAVDPEVSNRIRIKQATGAVTTFGKFWQAADPDEAVRKLSGSDHVDVVFISNRFPSADVTTFIKAAKQTPCGQDAAYVLICRNQEELSATFAQSVLLGVDGFLAEPYSVDALDEITKLAAKVKRERSDAREEAAIKFLMSQIADQISIVAQLKGHGLAPGRETKKLTEMCEIFKSLDDSARQRYHRIACDVFENAPVPKAPKVKAYGGTSSRVKKRMEAKILAELGGEAGAPAGSPEASTAPTPAPEAPKS